MPLTAFDHVNLRTAQLDRMIEWYGEFLGLQPGWRPDFPFPGAWLYLGDQAIVHLVEVDSAPPASDDLTLEHFALSATGFEDFIAFLESREHTYRVTDSEKLPVIQVNIWDPDGNHIHIDFERA